MAKDEIIFVNGIKVKQRFPGLLGVSINVKYFSEFLKTHENKGYVNIDICHSQNKESWYAKLNTWQPTQKGETNKDENIVKFKDDNELISEDEIPF